MTPTRTVRSGELSLAVYEHGEAAPGRPTIVLVHGYPDAAGVWDAVAERLADRYHVCAYDVRGAGQSEIPRRVREFALDRLVEDLGAVADAVSPDAPIHLVGHDWGSIQSWEAVTTDRLRGRIASFTSISGPCIDHAGHWMRRMLRSAESGDRAQVARQLKRSWYIGAFQLPLLGPAMWKLGLARLWPTMMRRLEGLDVPPSPTQAKDGAVGVNLYRANFSSRMRAPRERHAEIPVQLVVATRDRFIERGLFDEIPHWVPNLHRTDIDAGHWVPLSHPDELAETIAAFVDGLTPAPVPRRTTRRTSATRKRRGGRRDA